MQHRRIIKQGPVVFATREDGTMDPSSPASHGLFLADTRYLSTFQLRFNGEAPILLGSTEEMLFEANFLQTNPAIGAIPENSVGLLQRTRIAEGAVHVTLTVANWTLKDVEFDISIEVDSDFFDSFEARGVKRMKRGTLYPPTSTANSVVLSYLGCDNVKRSTHIETVPAMDAYQDRRMHFHVKLGINERSTIDLALRMVEMAPEGVNLQPEPSVGREFKPEWFDQATIISVDNNRLSGILQRSSDDLEVLLTKWGKLWVPAAGLPRFAVPFGRDCLITGLQTLIWNHRLARDVLCFLATTQGKVENPWNYEQPGKIMHEMHTGELARLREVPFGLFYGSVDSTALFLVLGGEYLRWTGDLELFRQLRPHFEAAWKWIDDFGNIDGSGYIQYKAHTPPALSSAALTVGLFNQGWKDSANAVMYGDGTMVTDHPVALAEVQGYLYRALRIWSEIYAAMPVGEGMRDQAAILARRADQLYEKFNKEFWMPEKKYYAMALDGRHRQVDSITSNPAHCLWCRLIDPAHADEMVATLMAEPLLNAWGVRTMAATERAYNPFSYHNGSIWPFENALIAAGLKKYGFVYETQIILDALVDASHFFEYSRWPEVYCGVARDIGGVLARQPNASRPQAWSAGTIFLLLQTVFGIAPRPFSSHVDITPALPSCLREFSLDNLSIAGGTFSARLVRDGNSVLMEIRDNPHDLDILIHPATRNHGRLAGDHLPAVSR